MPSKVLFVDDEVNVIDAIQRRLHKFFEMDTARGGEEGLALLDAHGCYPVVISDLRMPEMDGMRFLRQVKKKCPQAICIILTGHAQLQIAIDAVNEGLLFRFLVKPCKTDVLVKAISDGLVEYQRNVAEARRIQDDTQAKLQLKKLLSPGLAEMVSSGQLKVERGGQKLTATVMFVDICGFTALSETIQATEVLEMLNEYFEVIVDIVLRYEGTLDKFIGDEMMVIWGAPVQHGDDPERAVRAALDIQKALVPFNKMRAAVGQGAIQVGIGINTGEMVAGYVGSTQTMGYSVIGDTVNMASRLCSAAAADQILVSQNTYQHLQSGFTACKLEPLQVKGKAKPVQAYRILSCI